MELGFILGDNEDRVTPMRTAEALVASGQFTHKELKEIIAYLSVYTKYNQP